MSKIEKKQLTPSSCSIFDGKVAWRCARGRRRQAGTRPRHICRCRTHSNETAIAIWTGSWAFKHRRVADRHSGALRIFKNAERQSSGETFYSVQARVRRRALHVLHQQERCNLRTKWVICSLLVKIKLTKSKSVVWCRILVADARRKQRKAKRRCDGMKLLLQHDPCRHCTHIYMRGW